MPGQGRRRRVAPESGHGHGPDQGQDVVQASGPGQGYHVGQTYGPGAGQRQVPGRRRRPARSLPFGLDSAVPAERRTLFLLAWAVIVLIAILIGYTLASGGGQDSAVGTPPGNNSAARFVHSVATAHTLVGS